jgi:hypothetical protein
MNLESLLSTLQSDIMNIPAKRADDEFESALTRALYKEGHRDALTLYSLIVDATETITVMVPSSDFYRRAGDTEEAYLEYISPHKLLTALQERFGELK